MSSGARVVTHRNRAGELANLGSRLVRLGQMLQDDQTKIGELMRLAQECRFNLNLHVATDSEGRGDEYTDTENVSRHERR